MKKILVSLLAFTLVPASAQISADVGNLRGGLVVQLGANDTQAASMLSQSGHYLIHLLDADFDVVAKARQNLRANGRYGLAWAEKPTEVNQLPYAENVVNLIIVRDYTVAPKELARVLAPGGRLIVANPEILTKAQIVEAGFTDLTEANGEITARKPWPETMDGWSHPRHGADGNAVSRDTDVGPPQRVRWVAAATWEVEGMVSAGGRNFYGGTLARDSFNGLRLWHRDLARGGEADANPFKLPRISADTARPVASQDHLFAILKNVPVAIDGKSGEVAHEFTGVESPNLILNHGDVVVIGGEKGVHRFDAHTGAEVWKIEAKEPHDIVANDSLVSFIHGRPKRGEKSEAVTLDLKNGEILWRTEFEWLDKVTRSVLHEKHLAYELSTFNDHDGGNAINLVHAQNGDFAWKKSYAPGMNHKRQARALFLDDAVWILHGGKINTTADKAGRVPVSVSALELDSGETMVTHSAGLAHCFPPVATPNFMFAGELDLTDLHTGDVVANRITKANCSRENGWVPANGLIYTTPKHCTCWPMLRGFVSMAPARPGGNPAKLPLEEIEFIHETGLAETPDGPAAAEGDWPIYRGDVWRSGSQSMPGPKNLEIAWKTQLASPMGAPTGPILHDWNENPYIKGPLTAPVIVNQVAYLSRPDAHEVLAVKADGSGETIWRFTARGRIDAPPTYHNGLVLFGDHAGWVHALRSDTGEIVWRFRAAPTSERIVAYGQVESPWPVAGSVLVDQNVAYFVAGRQELADGGVLTFAVDAMTGQKQWVHRIDEVPQKGFYENSGLEFDPVDMPILEGDKIAMSRWLIDRDGKKSTVDKWNGFSKLDVDGEGAVWAPRGFWTYGARHQYRFAGEAPKRPLCAYRGGQLVGQLNGSTDLFLRDFEIEEGDDFNSKWITGWQASKMARAGEKPYRSYRIAEEATWKVDPFTPAEEKVEKKPGTQVWNDVYGMVLAGDERVFVAHKDGRVKALSLADGSVTAETQVSAPVWDSLVLADEKLFLTTMKGELVCIGTP